MAIAVPLAALLLPIPAKAMTVQPIVLDLSTSGGKASSQISVINDAAKPLRSKLLAVPALRERYLAYVRDIADRWLDWRVLLPMVRQWQALIEPDVTVESPTSA